jgi:hypothetical protein
MKQSNISIALATLAVLGAGFFLYTRSTDKTNHVFVGTAITQNAPYTVEVRPEGRVRSNTTTRLHFTTKKEGVVSDIYAEDKVLHYVIASENLKDFYHTYAPEVAGPGEFYLDHRFTQPGRYRIWTELVDTTKGRSEYHGQHAELISYVDLEAQGSATGPSIPFVPGLDAWADKWHVITERTGLRAGAPTTFRLHVENAAGTTLPVFAEEPAIYVMVGPNLEFFRHTHTKPAINGQLIEFTETFPAAGTYLVFTETYAEDGEGYQAIQVPFRVTIP